ncbi:MAG: nuclease (SNase) [Rhodospirillales bacterium RIFCSPLOWO2_12_FULL_58_28]|nr:MAG: nuclease (SNase) [Rhodospirillales bacterium RIFCSPLOWO2_02_FULL_58_16]OHC79212.1 MAG: nuclease (SNase) [Rhodospirillales bacterium RIFCSPLOWO2_12_FULL_58_28]
MLVFVLLLSGGAGAETLTSGGAARVTEIIDGDTITLDDGRQVRLVGIQAPKLPLGRRDFKTWPLADEAKHALEKMISGRVVELRHGGEKIDRHGRTLAHLFLENGVWAQGEMLKAGMARVYTFPDNREMAASMYAIEHMARQDRRGIWDHPFYAVRTPEEASERLGTFQVVEGVVMDAVKVKGVVYLNFGADWRKDFTVMIPSGATRMFLKDGIDPLSFKGKKIRARGWLKERNGPMIEASHPEQLE